VTGPTFCPTASERVYTLGTGAAHRANQRLYGKAFTAKKIVLENAVKTTPGGQALDSLLNTKVAKHSS
jgi:hypothetical protein